MVKWIHVSSVLLTFVLFVVRGSWMVWDSPLLKQRWVKVVPHIVDTVLLGSAIVLALQIRQYPFVHGWLTAKVLGLLVYIGLGMLAFRGPTRRIRVAAWLAALIVFVYIVSVAVAHHPLPLT